MTDRLSLFRELDKAGWDIPRGFDWATAKTRLTQLPYDRDITWHTRFFCCF